MATPIPTFGNMDNVKFHWVDPDVVINLPQVSLVDVTAPGMNGDLFLWNNYKPDMTILNTITLTDEVNVSIVTESIRKARGNVRRLRLDTAMGVLTFSAVIEDSKANVRIAYIDGNFDRMVNTMWKVYLFPIEQQ